MIGKCLFPRHVKSKKPSKVLQYVNYAPLNEAGMAWSQEDIYFIKNDKLFKIQLLDVDNQDNRALYDKILFTFTISE